MPKDRMMSMELKGGFDFEDLIEPLEQIIIDEQGSLSMIDDLLSLNGFTATKEEMRKDKSWSYFDLLIAATEVNLSPLERANQYYRQVLKRREENRVLRKEFRDLCHQVDQLNLKMSRILEDHEAHHSHKQ